VRNTKRESALCQFREGGEGEPIREEKKKVFWDLVLHFGVARPTAKTSEAKDTPDRQRKEKRACLLSEIKEVPQPWTKERTEGRAEPRVTEALYTQGNQQFL